MNDKPAEATNASTEMRLPGLEGRRVVITAGAGGIGFAIARQLHAQGARLAICDVDADALERASEALEGCIAEVADVSDDASVEAFFDKVRADLGGLDALVNNAGIAGPTGNLEDLSPADWRRCVDICLTGQFLCARQAIPIIVSARVSCCVISSRPRSHGVSLKAWSAASDSQWMPA